MQYSRVRSRQLATPATQVGKLDWWKYPGGTHTPVFTPDAYSYTSEPGLDTELCHDTNTPHFRRRSARGEIINNDFYRRRETFVPSPITPFSRAYIGTSGGFPIGSRYVGEKAMVGNELGTFMSGDLSSAEQAEIEALRQDTITRAHAKASSMEISVPMVAAEAGKTVASIASIARRVFKIGKAIKRLDIAYLKREISRKELENRYMELRYALRPLVIDANNVVAATDKTLVHSNGRRTARASAVWAGKSNDEVAAGALITQAIANIKRSKSHVVVIRAGVLSDIRPSNLSIWGADSILETVWEIIPFSFIFDWFVNVGDTLAAWTPNIGVTQLASWTTVNYKTVLSNSLGPQQGNTNPTLYTQENSFSWSGTKTLTIETTVRTANPNLSVWPRYNVSLDPLKLLDLAIIGKKLAKLA